MDDAFESLVEDRKENVQDVVVFVTSLLRSALNECKTTLPERYVHFGLVRFENFKAGEHVPE